MARRAVATAVSERVTGVLSKVGRRPARKTPPEPAPMQAQRGRPRLEPLSVDRAWFVDQLRRRKLSQGELARMLHKDASTITHVLSGAHRVKLDDAVAIATLLKVDISTVLRKLGYDVEGRSFTIRGAVRESGQITSISARSGSTTRIDIPPAATSALICEARSGALAAYDGAMFLYAEADGPGSHFPPDSLGRLCIVEAAEQVVPLLGVLTKGPSRGATYTLHPFGGGESMQLREVFRAMPVLAIIFG